MSQTIALFRRALPAHAVLKVRAMVHRREFARVEQGARAALSKAHAAFEDAGEDCAGHFSREAEPVSPVEMLAYRNRLSVASKFSGSRLACISSQQNTQDACG